MDITPLITALTESVSNAKADQDLAQCKCRDLCKGADVFDAQAKNTATPPLGRANAQLTAFDLRIKAAHLRLETARHTAALLAVAKITLNEILSQIDASALQGAENLPTPASQSQVDTAITNFDFAAGSRIDVCPAQALSSARDFYSLTSKDATNGQDWITALRLVAKNLSAWEARNREVVVNGDVMMRRLELAQTEVITSKEADVRSQESGNLNSFGVQTCPISTSSQSQVIPSVASYPSPAPPHPPMPFPPTSVYIIRPSFVPYTAPAYPLIGTRVVIQQFPPRPSYYIRQSRGGYRR